MSQLTTMVKRHRTKVVGGPVDSIIRALSICFPNALFVLGSRCGIGSIISNWPMSFFPLEAAASPYSALLAHVATRTKSVARLSSCRRGASSGAKSKAGVRQGAVHVSALVTWSATVAAVGRFEPYAFCCVRCTVVAVTAGVAGLPAALPSRGAEGFPADCFCRGSCLRTNFWSVLVKGRE